MYKYYCKDSNCPGHTKSWERCCDLRAFATRQTAKPSPFQTRPSFNTTRTTFATKTSRVFA